MTKTIPMSNALERIISAKRNEVVASRNEVSLEQLKDTIDQQDPPRRFLDAMLAGPAPRVIAEIKRKSPSAGVIREQFDPVDIARRYHEAGAAAISCLTDREHFGGSLGFIRQIRDSVPLPVLRKDFIIDPYQVWQSRGAGADAILLIAEAIDEALIRECVDTARGLGMTTLVEVHDRENLESMLGLLGDPIEDDVLLGINNRDLRTMTTSVTHTIELLEGVKDRTRIVSESGIRNNDDVQALAGEDVNKVLVGECLLRQEDPGGALLELMGR